MDYAALVNGFFGLALFAAALAALPDPYAFDRHWVMDESRRGRDYGCPGCRCWSHREWQHLLRARNYVTHLLSLAFVALTIFLLFRHRVVEDAASDKQVAIAVVVCVGLGAVAACMYHYTTGLVVSAALLWLVTVKLHATTSGAYHWVINGGVAAAALLLALGLCYCGTEWVLKHVLDVLQYPASAGFTLAFATAFLVRGWREYVVITHDGSVSQAHLDVWPPTIGAVAATAGISVLQLLYARADPCNWGMAVTQRPGRGRRPQVGFRAAAGTEMEEVHERDPLTGRNPEPLPLGSQQPAH